MKYDNSTGMVLFLRYSTKRDRTKVRSLVFLLLTLPILTLERQMVLRTRQIPGPSGPLAKFSSLTH